jgi:hypothetical protein
MFLLYELYALSFLPDPSAFYIDVNTSWLLWLHSILNWRLMGLACAGCLISWCAGFLPMAASLLCNPLLIIGRLLLLSFMLSRLSFLLIIDDIISYACAPHDTYILMTYKYIIAIYKRTIFIGKI